MTHHTPGQLDTELHESVARILDGDDSDVPATIRCSAALKASGIDHTLSVTQGSVLRVDEDNDRRLRALVDELPAGLRDPQLPGEVLYPLSEAEMDRITARLHESWNSGGEG